MDTDIEKYAPKHVVFFVSWRLPLEPQSDSISDVFRIFKFFRWLVYCVPKASGFTNRFSRVRSRFLWYQFLYSSLTASKWILLQIVWLVDKKVTMRAIKLVGESSNSAHLAVISTAISGSRCFFVIYTFGITSLQFCSRQPIFIL